MKIFTPLFGGVRQNWKNVKTLEGYKEGRFIGLKGIVELEDGRKFKVYGRSCSLPNCQFDAEVKEVEA